MGVITKNSIHNPTAGGVRSPQKYEWRQIHKCAFSHAHAYMAVFDALKDLHALARFILTVTPQPAAVCASWDSPGAQCSDD